MYNLIFFLKRKTKRGIKREEHQEKKELREKKRKGKKEEKFSVSVQIYLVIALLFFNKYLQFWIIALSVSNCMTLLLISLMLITYYFSMI